MWQRVDERGRTGGHALQPLHCPGAGGCAPSALRNMTLLANPSTNTWRTANPKYTFDVKAYLEHRLKAKPEEEYELYDLGELPPETAG